MLAATRFLPSETVIINYIRDSACSYSYIRTQFSACHHKERTHIENYYQQVAVENIWIWESKEKVGENWITVSPPKYY
jgi:hypothetical protein